MTASSEWWVDLYDDLLAESLLVRASEAETRATLEFLERSLGLRPGMRVFDQCCGIGSLAVPLAERGLEVVGVDQAGGYIERARQAAHDRSVDARVRLHTADAFEYVCEPKADAAINWWTSYGYAASDARNRSMLQRAFESLVPGGKFALDVPNLAGVLGRFEPDRTDTRETPIGLVKTRRESRVNLVNGRLEKTWTFTVDGEERAVRKTSLRLALPHEHARDLETVGFRVEGILGGIDREGPVELDDLRCILIARRP